ncbi:MAG: hypothetical protein KBG15_20690 [Kofleriaceae bacterium]|nr:hypothetical protein [Kofleriaceae bacterium]
MSMHLGDVELAGVSTPAQIERTIDALVAGHGVADASVGLARKHYEAKRGNVHQDEELYEIWSAGFVEWLVIECGSVTTGPSLAFTGATQWRSLGNVRAATIATALATSHRSLFEILAMRDGRVEILDLLGGARFFVVEPRSMVGVEIGDVAELRLLGLDDDVYFAKTFVYHPKAARDDIVAHAQTVLRQGGSRLDAVDAIAVLRAYVPRYRHLPPARIYKMGSKLT